MRATQAAVGLAVLVLGAGCGGDPIEADPALVPTPIGRGPAFQPPPRPPLERACAGGPVEGRFRAHVELFGRGRAIVVPAGIGLGLPLRSELGRVVSARCRARVRTLDPTGVVHFDRRGLRLRDLFETWRSELAPDRLLSFDGPVAAFVDGRRVAGDPAVIALRDGAQIVLETGGYVPPHRTYLFPPRG